MTVDEPPFPKDVSIPPDTGLPNCPWCKQDISDARLRLEDLIYANQDDVLAHAFRNADGTAIAGALVLECPHCERPSMLRLWAVEHDGDRTAWAKLVPVRTAKDVQLLQGAAVNG